MDSEDLEGRPEIFLKFQFWGKAQPHLLREEDKFWEQPNGRGNMQLVLWAASRAVTGI